jgi:alpha-beta hydrolase superfamily lysophospholipase
MREPHSVTTLASLIATTLPTLFPRTATARAARRPTASSRARRAASRGSRRAASASLAVATLRAQAFRLVKAPLLGRYAVRWHWPRTADLYAWERLSFPSRSGARLAGLYGTARTSECKGVVVCVHPLRRDAKGYFLSSGRAEVLRRNGYDVLLFDLNGFGESSHGDFNYVQDVLAAADYACGRAGGLPVHALAACFGAVWTLCAATQDHPFNGVVIEAPITSLHEYYTRDPVARTFLGLLWRLFPRSASNATPIEAAGKIAGMPRLLVIGGVEDTIAPIDMSRRLYEACNLPRATREIWYVDGAKHLRAYETAPQEYEERLSRFFAGAAEMSALVW